MEGFALQGCTAMHRAATAAPSNSRLWAANAEDALRWHQIPPSQWEACAKLQGITFPLPLSFPWGHLNSPTGSLSIQEWAEQGKECLDIDQLLAWIPHLFPNDFSVN